MPQLFAEPTQRTLFLVSLARLAQFLRMAWRIDEQVVRGELDNRVRGRVRGRIWLLGIESPIELDLEGNPWRDLAGHRIAFVNPMPKPGGLDGLVGRQCGSVGDMTASRKVKSPDCAPDEFHRHLREGTPFPWCWANALLGIECAESERLASPEFLARAKSRISGLLG